MKKSFVVYCLFSLSLWSQQTLRGTFSPSDTYKFAFLYEATPQGANYVDRAQLDSLGSFQLNLPASLNPGIYKIVYAIPPEENNFDFIYNGKEDVSFKFDQDNGIHFTESSENKLWASYLKSMEMINQSISNYYSKDGENNKSFRELFKTLEETQDAYESSAQGMLAATFIKSNSPYIPEAYEDVSKYSENLKVHYFNAVDFDNALLQSSSFIADRINNYVFGVSDEPSDSIYQEQLKGVSTAISGATKNTQVIIYEMLWEEFVQINNEPMAIYTANTYLKPLAKETEKNDLLTKVTSFEQTAIGSNCSRF